MVEPVFIYKAIVQRCMDGDTLLVDTDLGFHVYSRIKLRCARINTPEMHDVDTAVQVKAQKSKDFTEKKTLGKEITFQSHRTDKYDRWISEIYFMAPADPPQYDKKKMPIFIQKNLSDELLKANLAELYKGG